jgi:hypothetical protein
MALSPRLQKLDALLDFLVERLVAEAEEPQAATPAIDAPAEGVSSVTQTLYPKGATL